MIIKFFFWFFLREGCFEATCGSNITVNVQQLGIILFSLQVSGTDS